MHRYFLLLIPLVAVVLAMRTQGDVPRPANPPLTIHTLMDQLDAVQAGQDRDKIEQTCNAVLLIQPANYRAQMVLADLHFARKDYRKSAGDYARVLLGYPRDEAALSGAAWSAIHIGDLSRAERDFSTLVAISPDYPNARLGHEVATGSRPVPNVEVAAGSSSALASPAQPIQK